MNHELVKIEQISRYTLKCGNCGKNFTEEEPVTCMGQSSLSIDDPYICPFCMRDGFIDENQQEKIMDASYC